MSDTQPKFECECGARLERLEDVRIRSVGDEKVCSCKACGKFLPENLALTILDNLPSDNLSGWELLND